MINKDFYYENEYFNIGHNNYDINSASFNVNSHIHDLYEIYYFLKGDVTYYIEGQGYKIEKGDLLIINSQELHKPIFNTDSTYERIVVHFLPWYISKYNSDSFNLLGCFENRDLGKKNKLPHNSIQKHNLDKKFKKIIKYIKNNLDESEVMIETLFIQLLVSINNIFNNEKNIKNNIIEYNDNTLKIIKFINKNLEKKITLDLLANEFFLDKYYLSHLFKKNTGFSVIQYVNYKKIMKAKELLSHNLTCNEVSNKLAFGDYSNFYKAFKKNVGISPSKYQNKNTFY